MNRTKHPFRRLAALCAALASVATPFLLAETIGWHDDMSLAVGQSTSQGIDMRNQAAIKPPVAEMYTNPSQTDYGEATVEIAFAQHKFDLAKKFSLNSCISAKSFVASGSVKFSMVDNLDYSENTLNFAYICKRDFGTTRYLPKGVSPQLRDFVAELQHTMPPAAMRKAVADQFGTHFVTGVRKAARVAAFYSFHFDSQAVAQSYALEWAAKYGSGGGSSSAFSGDVKTSLEQKNTRISMSYRLYTTDSTVPWPIATQGAITNYQQFLDITTALETYSQSLSPDRAKPSSFVVEPDQNISGFDGLFGDTAATPDVADYERFMEVYAKFKHWEDLLSGWAVDTRRMSWMNTNGQQLVIDMRKDVTAHRKALDQMAAEHFKSGTPLVVADELYNYLVQLNRIPLPTANVAFRANYNVGGASYVYAWLGYIYAGSRESTVDTPFVNVSYLNNGIEVVNPHGNEQTTSPVQVYWDIDSFEVLLNSWSNSSPWIARYQFARDVLNSPAWAALKTASVSQRIGVFVIAGNPADGDPSGWILGIRDGTGQFVDLWSINESRSAIGGPVLQASSSVDVSVDVRSEAANAVVGASCDYVVGVTNSGPGAAYGVTVSLPVDQGFDVIGVSGSQGSGGSTNGQVTYLVGSLANGGDATIRLRLVPLAAGSKHVGDRVSTAVGAALTNVSGSTSTALGTISAQPPELTVARGIGKPTVSWTSETTRLALERTSNLQGKPVWTAVSAGVDGTGAQKQYTITNSGPSAFYRLHVQ